MSERFLLKCQKSGSERYRRRQNNLGNRLEFNYLVGPEGACPPKKNCTPSHEEYVV